MAEFIFSAFADEAGGGLLSQIDALKANGLTHIEPRGLDEGNISLYSVEQAKELKKILDDNGKIDLNKFSPITYDPVHHTYHKIGDVVGKAFSDGLKLK